MNDKTMRVDRGDVWGLWLLLVAYVLDDWGRMSSWQWLDWVAGAARVLAVAFLAASARRWWFGRKRRASDDLRALKASWEFQGNMRWWRMKYATGTPGERALASDVLTAMGQPLAVSTDPWWREGGK